MKLKNLLIASLALFTFASCSKSDDVEPEKPAVPVDAVISFLTNSELKTKTDTKKDSIAGVMKESDVKSLNAYVFNEAGQLVGFSRAESEDGKSLDRIDSVLIKVTPNKNGTSDGEFKLVVLANVDKILVSSLSELQGKAVTKNISNYTLGSLMPMNSKVITFNGVRPSGKIGDKYVVNNWVNNSGGATRLSAGEGTDSEKMIALNRMVARVQVESIQMDLAVRYPEASFELDTISMVNVRTQAALPTDGALEALGLGGFVKGYQSTQFVEGTDENPGVIKEPSNEVESLWKAGFTFGEKKLSEEVFDDSEETDLEKKNFCCYIFPNPETEFYKTALLISGRFKRYATATPELKHYMVKLFDGTNPIHYRVLANNVYKLVVKLNGEGSKDENHPEITAGVTVDITVAPWNVIDQTEDDTNVTP